MLSKLPRMNTMTQSFNAEQHPDLEQSLADILQEEIWKEITADTGLSKAEYDQQIINQIIAAARKEK